MPEQTLLKHVEEILEKKFEAEELKYSGSPNSLG
jgi:hypothetical protein